MASAVHDTPSGHDRVAGSVMGSDFVYPAFDGVVRGGGVLLALVCGFVGPIESYSGPGGLVS